MKEKVKVKFKDKIKIKITSAVLINKGKETKLDELKGLEFSEYIGDDWSMRISNKVIEKLKSIGLSQFTHVLEEDKGWMDVGIQGGIHGIVHIEFDKEVVLGGEGEIDILFSDMPVDVEAEVGGQTLVFKFRKVSPLCEIDRECLPCSLLCPYGEGEKDCSKIPDPRDPQSKYRSFLDFCGEYEDVANDENFIDIIPVKGTIEEEFKKIGIDI